MPANRLRVVKNLHFDAGERIVSHSVIEIAQVSSSASLHIVECNHWLFGRVESHFLNLPRAPVTLGHCLQRFCAGPQFVT